MIKKLILPFIVLFSLSLQAEDCSSEIKKSLKKKDVKMAECQVLKGLVEDKSLKHVMIIREEGLAGRGIGVELYKEGDYKKPIYEDYGLGQVLGHFMMNDKKSNVLVRDIDGDGINEFGFNVLNERSALFFMYHHDSSKKTFKAVNFKRKVQGEIQTMDRLVSTLDYPLEFLSDEIKVWYEKEKYFTYKLKDGEFFSDMD